MLQLEASRYCICGTERVMKDIDCHEIKHTISNWMNQACNEGYRLS